MTNNRHYTSQIAFESDSTGGALMSCEQTKGTQGKKVVVWSCIFGGLRVLARRRRYALTHEGWHFGSLATPYPVRLTLSTGSLKAASHRVL